MGRRGRRGTRPPQPGPRALFEYLRVGTRSRPRRLPKSGKTYTSGLYDVDGMLQYTNRGLEMLPPHLRVNCRPEITIFTLLAPA